MSIRNRLISAFILAPILLGLIIFSPPWVFILLGVIISLIAADEWFRMVDRRLTDCWSVALFLIIMPWGFLYKDSSFWPFFITLMLITLALAALLAAGKPGDKMAYAQETAFPLLFIGIPIDFFVILRLQPLGRGLVSFLILTIWAVDTMAYFIGVNYGRRAMAPILSPKKTWEGLFGALTGGLLAGAVLGPLLLEKHVLISAILGMILAILGQISDLFVSLWKRAAGFKDSGNLIPGHGGLLDRLDSYLLTAPALYSTFFFINSS